MDLTEGDTIPCPPPLPQSICNGACIQCLTSNKLVSTIYRVGQDLQTLYNSPPVQSFLNGVPAKELYQDKIIYSHATLRKVRACRG